MNQTQSVDSLNLNASLRNGAECRDREFHARKMEAIGQLAGGLAHDFNNLLGVILGYCEMLGEHSDLPAPAHGMVREIQNAGTAAKNLTQRLLAFSRQKAVQPVVLDLNRTVKRVEGMLGRIIGQNITLESEPGAKHGIIKADPSQVELMLVNLAINARDAMPNGGRIAIKTANIEIDTASAERNPATEPGRYVLLSVSDTGNGMDAETLSHIFEPFYTTKPFGQGTGLGLSNVISIVKQSGGFITVDSEPGRGAAFNVYLPECHEAPLGLRPAAARPLRRGTETILLVDDAAPLRALMRRILEEFGYTVLESGEPAQALRLAEAHRGRLSLMITDVVMPGMTGLALAEKLAAVRPETRVLYSSGYNDGVTPFRVPGQDSAFLEKPFRREDLLRKVRELLDSQAKFPPRSAGLHF